MYFVFWGGSIHLSAIIRSMGSKPPEANRSSIPFQYRQIEPTPNKEVGNRHQVPRERCLCVCSSISPSVKSRDIVCADCSLTVLFLLLTPFPWPKTKSCPSLLEPGRFEPPNPFRTLGCPICEIPGPSALPRKPTCTRSVTCP